ncbi:MAG: pyridoxal phosphate-dependent aminotransferase [Acidobacteriota bacterium]
MQPQPKPTQPDIRAIARLIKPSGNLVQGQNEIPIHPDLREALTQVVAEGLNHYSFFEGVAELRQAVAEKIKLFNGITVNPEAQPLELMITPGGTGGIVTVSHTYLRQASAVVFEPYYPYHKKTLATCDAKTDVIKLKGDNLVLDLDELRKVCAEGVNRSEYPIKAIIVCSPANPTGRVLTRDELTGILKIAEEFNLFIIADEVYEHFTLTSEDHISIASLPGGFERTITVNSFSKSWAISGWRIGYMYGPGHLIGKIGLLGNLYYVCTPTPLQHALSRVLMADPSFYGKLRLDFGRKRKILCDALESVGFQVYNSRSAFYLWAKIPPRFNNSVELNEFLIKEAGVAAVPGSAFMDNLEEDVYMRWCFAREDAMLEEASAKIKKVLG